MRVTPMILARQAVHFINLNADVINRSLERLGTGRRINRAHEDPPGTVLSMRLQSDIASVEGDYEGWNRHCLTFRLLILPCSR